MRIKRFYENHSDDTDDIRNILNMYDMDSIKVFTNYVTDKGASYGERPYLFDTDIIYRIYIPENSPTETSEFIEYHKKLSDVVDRLDGMFKIKIRYHDKKVSIDIDPGIRQKARYPMSVLKPFIDKVKGFTPIERDRFTSRLSFHDDEMSVLSPIRKAIGAEDMNQGTSKYIRLDNDKGELIGHIQCLRYSTAQKIECKFINADDYEERVMLNAFDLYS